MRRPNNKGDRQIAIAFIVSVIGYGELVKTSILF